MEMTMLFPRLLPNISDFNIHWDPWMTFSVRIGLGPSVPQQIFRNGPVADITALLLRSVFRNRMESQQTDFIAHFVPTNTQDLRKWYKQHRGTTAAHSMIGEDLPKESVGIVRELTRNGVTHIFCGIERLQPSFVGDQLDGAQHCVQETVREDVYIRAKRLTKRADFLHPIPLQDRDKLGSSSTLLPVKDCSVDKLPFIYSQCAMFIPSILHKVEVNMIVEDLCKKVLPFVRFNDHSLVLTAISTTAAQESTNYQRLEFLGDSILKAFTSLTLLTTHLNWHEGMCFQCSPQPPNSGDFSCQETCLHSISPQPTSCITVQRLLNCGNADSGLMSRRPLAPKRSYCLKRKPCSSNSSHRPGQVHTYQALHGTQVATHPYIGPTVRASSSKTPAIHEDACRYR